MGVYGSELGAYIVARGRACNVDYFFDDSARFLDGQLAVAMAYYWNCMVNSSEITFDLYERNLL
jgi:hypothetical protein